MVKRGGSAKGRGREIWPVFCDHAEADREWIGYHSLTPNTFTADTMINESRATLKGLFLDPLAPPPKCPATSNTTSPNPEPDPIHLDKTSVKHTYCVFQKYSEPRFYLVKPQKSMYFRETNKQTFLHKREVNRR